MTVGNSERHHRGFAAGRLGMTDSTPPCSCHHETSPALRCPTMPRSSSGAENTASTNSILDRTVGDCFSTYGSFGVSVFADPANADLTLLARRTPLQRRKTIRTAAVAVAVAVAGTLARPASRSSPRSRTRTTSRWCYRTLRRNVPCVVTYANPYGAASGGAVGRRPPGVRA